MRAVMVMRPVAAQLRNRRKYIRVPRWRNARAFSPDRPSLDRECLDAHSLRPVIDGNHDWVKACCCLLGSLTLGLGASWGDSNIIPIILNIYEDH